MDLKIKSCFLSFSKIIIPKAALFFYVLLTCCLIISLLPFTATAKQSEQFQIGEKILPQMIEVDDSDLLNLKSLKGKTILMVFASAEQQFSQKALQDVQSMVDKLKLKDITAIGIVSSPKGKQAVKRLVDKYQLKYSVYYDEEDITTQLRILVYPTTLIIDSKGRLTYYYSLYTSKYHDLVLFQLKRIINDQAKSYLTEETVKRQQKEEIKKARGEIERGKVKLAITTLTNLLQKGCDSEEVHLLLGYSLICLHQPEKALSHFKRAKERQPDSIRVELGMGIAYSRAGQMKNAISLLTKIIKDDPDSILAYRELAYIFEKKNEVDKAIYYIKKELDCLTHLIKD